MAKVLDSDKTEHFTMMQGEYEFSILDQSGDEIYRVEDGEQALIVLRTFELVYKQAQQDLILEMQRIINL